MKDQLPKYYQPGFRHNMEERSIDNLPVSGVIPEWLEGNLPDLIICDIHMPVMDGYRVIENVRKRGFTKHTPIIMLSGNESSKERV